MMGAKYWIAQHIPDLFRNEPRNVGVFALLDGELDARFYAEIEPGQFDGRKLRSFRYSDVYEQWVEYWRREAQSKLPDELSKSNGHHYRIIEGGQVDGVGSDSVQDVLNYLYALLVSEGGLAEALGAKEEKTTRSMRLVTEIASAFRERHILAEGDLYEAKHPIRRNAIVAGRKVQKHVPDFIQRNGSLTVMEGIDFTLQDKRGSTDHAGRSAYMFSDITDRDQTVETIAVVRYTEEDARDPEVQYGLEVLENEAEIVNWLEPLARQAFVRKRGNVAG